MKVRIKFSKQGAVRFIGHLDMMRYFQKAFRRSEIDIAYSAGFSPHQIMSFAAPLGVGLESEGEYMDVELNSMESSADIVSRMNQQMAEGIKVLSAKVLPEKSKKAMSSVAAAGYYIDFRDGFVPPMGWETAIADFMSMEQIIVTKNTKKSEIEIDLKPAIYDFKLSSYNEKDTVYLMVNASSSGNIKPAMVFDAFYRNLGLTFDAFNLLITREDTYLNLGTEEAPKFAPLDEIGGLIGDDPMNKT